PQAGVAAAEDHDIGGGRADERGLRVGRERRSGLLHPPGDARLAGRRGHGPRLKPSLRGSFATKSTSGFGSSSSSSDSSRRWISRFATAAPTELIGSGGNRRGSRSTTGSARTSSY